MITRRGFVIGRFGASRRAAVSVAVLVFCAYLLSARATQSHTMYLFATQRGDWVEGKVYFRGGSGAAGAKVEVYDPDGTALQELVCDDEGRFRFPFSRPGKLRLVGRLEDGHSTEYQLEVTGVPPSDAVPDGSSRLAAPPTADRGDSEPSAGATAEPAPRAEDSRGKRPGAEAALADELGRLRQAVERLQDEIVRLREDIDVLRHTAGWKDVLGGVGYLLGLTGIAFYFLARRRGLRSRTADPAAVADDASAPDAPKESAPFARGEMHR